MRIRCLIIVILGLLTTTGCYLPMTGTVVDAQTQQPIEGAVLLVEWTKANYGGGADPYTTSYKVAESISDKDGKVAMPGCFCLFTNEPDVTVYKKGYVAWNNKYIFPEYKKRKDFRWGGDAFRLERFKEEDSYDKHVSFIHSAIKLGLGEKKLIVNAYDWEETEAFKERKSRWGK